MKKENTALRLQKIMKNRGLRQVDILELAHPFCEKYDVKLNKSDLSQYVSGKNEPGQDKLFVLGQALGVNESWLMGHDVPMEHQQPNMGYAKELLFEMVKDSPSMPSGDRLSFLFDKLDYDPMEIAHNLDIDQYHMNSWVLHNNLPPRPIVDKIAACVQMKPIELLNSDEFVHYSLEVEDFGPVSEDRISADELSIIKKYRRLDRYGKEAVDSVLDVEWRRCKPPAEEQVGISLAARKSDEPHAATGPDTDVEI